MFSKGNLKVWLGRILACSIIISTAYLLIPKNLGRLLDKDTNYYISINEMYYSTEENRILRNSNLIDVTDESYNEFIALLSEYNYYGFWHSLWGRNTSNPDVYYISNDSGKGFVIDNRGKFCLKRDDKLYTYYLEWFGEDKETRLYDKIKQFVKTE